MSLLSCISSSAQVGPTFDLKTHIAFIWSTVGSCVFKTVSDDVVEVSGAASILGISYNFDIIVTTEPGRILTVNGNVDTGATLSGCTVQARNTLDGYAFTFATYDGTYTEIETPDPFPNIFIAPR